MGGEELTLLLLQTLVRDAVIIAERIRATLDASPVSFGTAVVSLSVSASVGVAQWRLEENMIRLQLSRRFIVTIL
jgi:PleD family two-component response regulator